MSKYLEYLIELLEQFYKAPNTLMENEAQILLRLIKKAHKEHEDDLVYVLNFPEDEFLIPSWTKECISLTEKHTNKLWVNYYELIQRLDQQLIEEVEI